MARREVLASRKDREGDITALCNLYGSWSPRSKLDVIQDIESRTHQYYVKIRGAQVDIQVINDSRRGKYLRTDPDKTTSNNLDNLPDC